MSILEEVRCVTQYTGTFYRIPANVIIIEGTKLRVLPQPMRKHHHDRYFTWNLIDFDI
jgi:hypothetical protein